MAKPGERLFSWQSLLRGDALGQQVGAPRARLGSGPGDTRNPQGQSFVLVLCETEEEARVGFDQGLRNKLANLQDLVQKSQAPLQLPPVGLIGQRASLVVPCRSVNVEDNAFY